MAFMKMELAHENGPGIHSALAKRRISYSFSLLSSQLNKIIHLLLLSKKRRIIVRFLAVGECMWCSNDSGKIAACP